MKLATLIVSALVLVACSPRAGAIPPEDAAKHVGERGTVEGIVVKVGSSPKGHLFLNMGAPYPNHIFTGYVPAASVTKIGRDYIMALEGKKVSIAGEIKLYKGKPEIIVTEKNQLLEVR